MHHVIKCALIGFSVLELSSCVVSEHSTAENLNYPAYPSYNNVQFYTNNYNSMDYNYKEHYKYQERKEVIVPDSYHVGRMHSPVSFQDRDQRWVSSQNPQSYTIELAEWEKASQVAQSLYKAPKNERMAQIKSQRGGKEYYRGVYGTYNTAAEAQKALDVLPAHIKSGASVKNWGSIQ